MQNANLPPRHRMVKQASIVALAVMLLVLFFGALGNGAAPAYAERPLQVDTAYPDQGTEPPPGDSYPVETLPAGGEGGQATFAPTTGTTLLPTVTPTTTATLPPNLIQTENAEMGEGNVTPPPSETPGPTITTYVSATPTLGTAQPTRTPIARNKSESKVNWGLFWIGFSLPVLSACGLVLYLLDQRPDFFRPKKK